MTVPDLTRLIQNQESSNAYTCYHAPRYAVCLNLVRRYLVPASTTPVTGEAVLGEATAGTPRVLDVGRSELTGLIHTHLRVPVDSLGFEPDGPSPGGGQHYSFDLNRAQRRETWRTDLPVYDAVVFAEVIEHLYTSPALVLRFLRTLLKPGGVLVLQTPNAVSLTRRVRLLLGLHPYDPIAEDPTSPNHFREYTRAEMERYAAAAGFAVLHAAFYNYFDLRYGFHASAKTGSRAPRWVQRIKYALYRGLPGSLKPGLTLVLQRRDAEVVGTPKC